MRVKCTTTRFFSSTTIKKINFLAFICFLCSTTIFLWFYDNLLVVLHEIIGKCRKNTRDKN